MDSTKKKILESIGCIVGTAAEYLRLTEQEAAFFQNCREKYQEVERQIFEQDSELESPVIVAPGQMSTSFL